jgi:DNA processing protein
MTDLSAHTTASKLFALSRFGQVKPRLLGALLARFGDLDAILSATAAELGQVNGISPTTAQRVAACGNRLPEAEKYVQSLLQRDISVTTRFDSAYPHRLFELNDPPLMLFARGRMIDTDKQTIVLVGAEQATNEGIEVTSRLAKSFADAGVQVISSLIGGIAAAAHLAVKAAGSASFAVIDSGFDPLANSDEMPLAIDIAIGGGVISEFLPEFAATPESLMQSNRLLVGLANAVVFTELYKDSRRGIDLIEFCSQNGKLTFFFVNPDFGALSDEATLKRAVASGAILIRGYGSISDIVRSAV